MRPTRAHGNEMMTESPASRNILAHVGLPLERRADHIMPMPAVQRRWTAREVRELIDRNPLATPRYELVDGELLVTPSPSAVHQDAASLLVRVLNDYFNVVPIGHAYASPLDVDLEPELVVQPDVLAVPMREFQRLRRDRSKTAVRELLIAAEILSASSGRFDRVKKRGPYQRHVSEYWIVDLDSRVFERWQPNDARPDILSRELVWQPAEASEPFRLDLPRYFAQILDE